jgi:hypothetical protein
MGLFPLRSRGLRSQGLSPCTDVTHITADAPRAVCGSGASVKFRRRRPGTRTRLMRTSPSCPPGCPSNAEVGSSLSRAVVHGTEIKVSQIARNASPGRVSTVLEHFPPLDSRLTLSPLVAPLHELNTRHLEILQTALNCPNVQSLLERSNASDVDTATIVLELIDGGHLQATDKELRTVRVGRRCVRLKLAKSERSATEPTSFLLETRIQFNSASRLSESSTESRSQLPKKSGGAYDGEGKATSGRVRQLPLGGGVRGS